LLGGILNMIGSWVRVIGAISPNSFVILFIGQSLCSAAQCFILAVPPSVAMYWFPDRERTTATSIGSLCNQVGMAVRYIPQHRKQKRQN